MTLQLTIKSSTGVVASTGADMREFSKGSIGWNFSLGAVIPESKRGDISLEIADNDKGTMVFAGSFAPKKDLTGSYGLYAGGKGMVDGMAVQIGVNLTLRNSNPNNPDRYNPKNTTNFSVTGNVVVLNSAPQTAERVEAKAAAIEARAAAELERAAGIRAKLAAIKAGTQAA